ncbi:MAG: hypothetical protein ACR2HC_06720 [Thermoleophilaceae bacterium]
MAIGPAVERLLCDTSFHAHAKKRAQAPERYEHWAPETIERIDAAILAISVMTLAEARYGYLKAGWGERRIAEEEGRLAAYLLVPLDPGVSTSGRGCGRSARPPPSPCRTTICGSRRLPRPADIPCHLRQAASGPDPGLRRPTDRVGRRSPC